MRFQKLLPGIVTAVGLVLGCWSGPASAMTFYDWVPDPGSGGSGFMEFDTTGQSPDVFNDLDPIAFTFDFGVPTIPVLDFNIVTPATPFDAAAGKIAAGQIGIKSELLFDFGRNLIFTPKEAQCVWVLTVCYGSPPGEPPVALDISHFGSWKLRQDPPPVPAPASLILFGPAVAGLALMRWRKRPAK